MLKNVLQQSNSSKHCLFDCPTNIRWSLLGELSTNFTKVQISICNYSDFWNGHPFNRCPGSIQYEMEAISTRVWFNGTVTDLVSQCL